MNRSPLPMLALAAALSLSACGSDASSATSPSTAAPVASSSPPVARGAAVMEDTMTDDSWGWLEGVDPAFGSIEIAGGDQLWKRFTGRVSSWVPARLDDEVASGKTAPLRNVVVATDVTVTSGGGVVGVTCRLQPPGPGREFQWYEFVARDGFAAIRRANDAKPVETFAETKDVAMPLGTSATIEASCVDDATGAAALALTVNGVRVLRATAAEPLGDGLAGLQVWTFPEGAPMDIAWHEFNVYRSA